MIAATSLLIAAWNQPVPTVQLTGLPLVSHCTGYASIHASSPAPRHLTDSSYAIVGAFPGTFTPPRSTPPPPLPCSSLLPSSFSSCSSLWPRWVSL